MNSSCALWRRNYQGKNEALATKHFKFAFAINWMQRKNARDDKSASEGKYFKDK